MQRIGKFMSGLEHPGNLATEPIFIIFRDSLRKQSLNRLKAFLLVHINAFVYLCAICNLSLFISGLGNWKLYYLKRSRSSVKGVSLNDSPEKCLNLSSHPCTDCL